MTNAHEDSLIIARIGIINSSESACFMPQLKVFISIEHRRATLRNEYTSLDNMQFKIRYIKPRTFSFTIDIRMIVYYISVKI